MPVLPASGRSVPVLWNATPELRLTVMPFAPLPEMSFAAPSACEPRSTRMPVPVFDVIRSPVAAFSSASVIVPPAPQSTAISAASAGAAAAQPRAARAMGALLRNPGSG